MIRLLPDALYTSDGGAYYDICRRGTTLVSESMKDCEGRSQIERDSTVYFYICLFFFYSLFCATLDIL